MMFSASHRGEETVAQTASDAQTMNVVHIGPQHPDIDWSETILARSRFHNTKLPDMATLLDVAGQARIQMVFFNLTRDNWEELSSLESLSLLHKKHPPPVVVLLNEEMEDEQLGALQAKEFAKVMLYPYTIKELNATIEDVLRVRLRAGLRILFRLTLEGQASNQTCICNTLDISITGALVCSPKRFPEASHLKVKVVGIKELANYVFPAEVVREDAKRKRTGHHYYGLKFEFDEEGVLKDAWANFIDTLV